MMKHLTILALCLFISTNLYALKVRTVVIEFVDTGFYNVKLYKLTTKKNYKDRVLFKLVLNEPDQTCISNYLYDFFEIESYPENQRTDIIAVVTIKYRFNPKSVFYISRDRLVESNNVLVQLTDDTIYQKLTCIFDQYLPQLKHTIHE